MTERKNGVLTYLHTDHLGSPVLTTNSSGTTVTDHGYYAYGLDRRGGELGTDHRFTGQKLDGVGLQYFNARYYDPELGAFISPDTLVPDGGSVFGYNRYIYASGNPLKFSDPTGHGEFCSEPSSCIGGPISAGGGGSAASGYLSSGAGGNAKSTAQLVTDIVDTVVGATALVKALETQRESVTLERARVEVSGIPLKDQTPQTGWITSFDVASQQVLADPLPTVEMGSNVVYADVNWRGQNTTVVGRKS